MIAISGTKSLNPRHWFCKICQVGTCRQYWIDSGGIKPTKVEACSQAHALQYFHEDKTKISEIVRFSDNLTVRFMDRNLI